MFDKLQKKLKTPPTRDDVLCAISSAFDGAKVVAAVDSWDVHVETNPPRVIFVKAQWLAKYVEQKTYACRTGAAFSTCQAFRQLGQIAEK
jgi:hypothetical protein